MPFFAEFWFAELGLVGPGLVELVLTGRGADEPGFCVGIDVGPDFVCECSFTVGASPGPLLLRCDEEVLPDDFGSTCAGRGDGLSLLAAFCCDALLSDGFCESEGLDRSATTVIAGADEGALALPPP